MEDRHYKHTIQGVSYGDSTISFKLWYCARTTLAIHVYPDTSVVVEAPEDAPLEKVKHKVLKRAKWIKKQQYNFERFPPTLPARQYLSGESFRYLGRQYVLKIERDIMLNTVKLERGKLRVLVTRMDQERVKTLVEEWYRKRALLVFNERLEACRKIVAKANILYEGKIHLRKMEKRWGTCSKDAKISLNPELVFASKECIDYVIVHELCHLKEHNHSPSFFKLLDFVMPDWERCKEKLDITAETREI
jgi:predicted metal-dependent hydrolase